MSSVISHPPRDLPETSNPVCHVAVRVRESHDGAVQVAHRPKDFTVTTQDCFDSQVVLK